MTKKIFWEDPYLTQLETRIASVKGNDITVEQTIFYAFSGGQESDYGTIGNNRTTRLYFLRSLCHFESSLSASSMMERPRSSWTSVITRGMRGRIMLP